MADSQCVTSLPTQSPGPWFNIKMSSYWYRKSHCGDKTVVRYILVRRHLYIESGPSLSTGHIVSDVCGLPEYLPVPLLHTDAELWTHKDRQLEVLSPVPSGLPCFSPPDRHYPRAECSWNGCLHHHGGCKCPGACLAPMHLQQPWWCSWNMQTSQHYHDGCWCPGAI